MGENETIDSFLPPIYPSLSMDCWGSVGIKNPCFFGGFPCLLSRKQGQFFRVYLTTLDILSLKT